MDINYVPMPRGFVYQATVDEEPTVFVSVD